MPRQRNRRAALLAWALTPVVVLGACTGNNPASTAAQPTPGPTTSNPVAPQVTSAPAQRRQIEPPAWVERCLPKKASDRFGPAPRYVGMRYQAIARYPPRRHVSLLFGGAAGECYGMSDDVIRPNVIAIFYDRGDTRHFRIPASARVVFAEKVSSYWQPGS